MIKKEQKLSVGDRMVDTDYNKIKISQLHYYPKNPRISSITLSHKSKLTDEIIDKLMWDKQSESTRTLYRRIKEAGVVNEPLIVYENKTLEGNTRLCVVRQLIKEAKTKLEKEKWSRIPCRVIKDKLTNQEINFILCNVHIKTKKDWDPFEQACYFHRMRIEENMNNKQIAKLTEVNENKISDYIRAFKEMRRLNETGLKKFNYYYETIRQPEVKKIIDVEKKIDLLKIVKDKIDSGKIDSAQEVRKITTILKDSRATKMFFDGDADIKRAEQVALMTNPEEGDTLLKAIANLAEDLRHIKYDKFQDIKKDERKIKVVKELALELKKLCKSLDIKI